MKYKYLLEIVILAILLAACGDSPRRAAYRPYMPDVPSYWHEILGEPHWRLQWIGEGGVWKDWEGPPDSLSPLSKSFLKRGQSKYQGSLPREASLVLSAAASSFQKTASTPPSQLSCNLSPEASHGKKAPPGRMTPGVRPASGQKGQASMGVVHSAAGEMAGG